MSSMTWYSNSAATSSTTTATVFDKRYAKFVFNSKDVLAVYTDWGDGEGRSVDTANYQWNQYSTPVQETIIPHTYTATGTYNIITQTINQRGFASKYYASSSAVLSGNVSPYEVSTRISSITVSDGEATAIMKCENRTVKSGIDNSIFVSEGPKQVYAQIPPILNSTEYGYLPSKIKLGITAVLVDSIRDSSSNEAVVVGGSRRVKKFYIELDSSDAGDGTTTAPINILDTAKDISGTSAAIDGAAIAQILKVEYRNPKITGSYAFDYTRNEVFNRLKIFLTTKAIDGYYYPVTYVTAGSPIKSVDDLYRYITMDFSQSRAKASNVANSKYRYDNGKVFFKPAGDYQWAITGTNYFNNNTRQNKEVKREDYTYMPRPIGLRGSATYSSSGTQAFGNGKWVEDTTGTDATSYVVDQFALDDFGRFYDQYHLIRNSMQPSSSTDATGSSVSSIIANKPSVFRITPPVAWSGATDPEQSATKIDAPGLGTASGNYTADYTSEAFNNGSSNEISFTEMNGATFKDVDDDSRTANEYFLMLFPKKTNKVFFNMTNYANKLMSDWANATGVTIAGVYYLAVNQSGTINQSAEWKAVEFEDTTSIAKTYAITGNSDTLSGSYLTKEVSFAKSGYVSFDTPSDWQSIDILGLCGGYFSSTNQTATGSLGIKVTGGTVSGTTNAGSVIGNYLVVTGATISDQMGTHFNSANEVGAFKYIAFPSGTDDMPLWLAKGADNGWDGDDTLYFHYGENNASYYNVEGLSGEKSWIIRRVNIYDVLDGPSKVFKGSRADMLPPVDAGGTHGAITWNNMYSISLPLTTFGTAFKTDWTDDMYALKIAISGTGGAATVPKPEMWNVFDATEGHTAVVKQIDDSAYTLNSLPITSDISLTRAGNYFTAVSRKGKVFIAHTGTPLQELSFSSVALGDTSSASSAFTTSSDASSMYGHLHKVRELQSNSVRVYWDEEQKDGTWVRIWGIIKSVNDTYGVGGPKSVTSYGFTLMIEEIALLDINGNLMTDVFPIGGVEDVRSYA